MTWLDGRGQPHPDHEPETVTAPEGKKFTESVWSEALLIAVTELLAARGYAYRSGWTGSPGRGITCPILAIPQAEPAAPEQAGPQEAAEEAPEADGQLDLFASAHP